MGKKKKKGAGRGRSIYVVGDVFNSEVLGGGELSDLMTPFYFPNGEESLFFFIYFLEEI